MSNLRRSLQNKASNGGLSPTRAPAVAMAPPRKVIKALYDYNSQQSQELSFTKGDFFHVVGNEDDEDWYEACNPITGARGFVPVTYFQSLEKTGTAGPTQRRQRNSNQSFEDTGNDSGSFTDPSPHHYQQQQQQQQQQYQQNGHYQHSHSLSNGGGAAGGLSSASSPAMSQIGASSPTLPKCQPLYGIVLYDFGAERADELDCKVGDAILVIAQSNEEWYVAKPIGRLGGPGLIPVSFVEIRDMVTGKAINVPEMLRQTGTAIPRVEEWKKQAMEYKAKSIPLGRIDDQQQQQPPQQQQQPAPVQQQQQQQVQQQQHLSHTTGLGMHPQHFIQQHQQSTGPTIQQLKNKMSRGDLKSQQSTRDLGARRRPSQEDIGRRVDPSNGATAPLGSARSHHNDTYDDNNGHADHPSRIMNASVESFHHEDDQYWFTVRVELGSGATRNLFRLYEDFYDFHIALLEEFPVESGRVGDQPRILPFMPIPLQVVTDTVSASRRADLDGYVQDLCKLPSRITQHRLVEQLFAVREGDTETPAGSADGNGHGNGTPVSGGLNSPSLGRSSHNNGSSLPSNIREQERRPSPAANGGGTRAVFAARNQGQRSYGDDSPSGGASPSMRSQAQFPGSNNGPALGIGGLSGSASSEEMIKIKISYHEDIMAMRIPVSISFRSLQQKIFERLHSDHKDLSYRDDRGDFATIQNDGDVRDAIDRSGGKLMIYVD
ncbi:bud emergence protein 1 [Linnemannia schmuckeri]|uniref:Bud emergence protein 1 n=1 Tax=Linnemannia schmuckeri TaxID=64567 RepID=A0A9P5RTY4_9FUNG|nr:bud emergence protein 1 [Linnemannia schmuckeri]